MSRSVFLTFSFLLFCSFRLIAQISIMDDDEALEPAKVKEAVHYYETAVRQMPLSSKNRYQLAYAYIKSKDYRKSIKQCKKLLRLSDSNYEEKLGGHLLMAVAYDFLDKQQKAVNVYRNAIERFPAEPLLYYNLALSYYGNGNYKAAEIELKKAVLLEPLHASSHLLMANVKFEQQQRITSILPLYFFLLLEPDTKRSPKAYQMLNDLLVKGVEKRMDNQLSITIPFSEAGDDEILQSAEIMIAAMVAGSKMNETDSLPPVDEFSNYTTSLFRFLNERKAGQNSFWWETYIRPLSRWKNSEQIEALAHDISRSVYPKVVANWESQFPEQAASSRDLRKELLSR